MIKRLGRGLRVALWGADPAVPLRPRPWVASIGVFVLIAFGSIAITGLRNDGTSRLFAVPIGVLSVLPMSCLRTA